MYHISHLDILATEIVSTINWNLNFFGADGEVLVLEDITGTLDKPCIMDVKIGKQTWDPHASSSKMVLYLFPTTLMTPADCLLSR